MSELHPPVTRGNRALFVKEARRLHRAGRDRRLIAEDLGVSVSSVYNWTNPARYKKTLAREKAARRARISRQQDRNARAAQPSIAECYSLTRKLLAALDAAEQEQRGPARQALAAAHHRAYEALDEILVAVGVAGGSD